MKEKALNFWKKKEQKSVAVETHYHQQTVPNGVFQGFWLTQLSKPAILINACKSTYTQWGFIQVNVPALGN